MIKILDPCLCRCCKSMTKCMILTAQYDFRGEKEVYSEMILDTFGLLLSHLDGDEKDRGICAMCVVKLRAASSFRTHILQCELLFQQAIIDNCEVLPIKTEAGLGIDKEANKLNDDSVSIGTSYTGFDGVLKDCTEVLIKIEPEDYDTNNMNAEPATFTFSEGNDPDSLQNQRVFSRREIIDIFFRCPSKLWSNKFVYLEDSLYQTTKCERRRLKKIMSHFKFEFKARWLASNRKRVDFEKKNCNWLNGVIAVPIGVVSERIGNVTMPSVQDSCNPPFNSCSNVSDRVCTEESFLSERGSRSIGKSLCDKPETESFRSQKRTRIKEELEYQQQEPIKCDAVSYNVKNECVYCGDVVTNFSHHIRTHHPDEKDVIRYLSRNSDNFICNSDESAECMSNKRTKQDLETSYMMCVSCLDPFKLSVYNEHFKICHKNELIVNEANHCNRKEEICLKNCQNNDLMVNEANFYSYKSSEKEEIENKKGMDDGFEMDQPLLKLQSSKIVRKSIDSDSVRNDDYVKFTMKKGLRRKTVHVNWSEKEKEIVQKHFKDNISRKENPGKAKCLDVLKRESVLSKRSWQQLNTYVNNLYKKKIVR